MDALAPINAAVAVIDPAASPEVIAEAIGKVEHAKRAVRELDAALKAALLEWVQANGPLTLGTTRYYAGVERVKRCRDPRAALLGLLDAAGGDVDRVADCLASDGLKPGESAKVLGERFAEFFETTERQVLKDGKPAKALLKTDTRFTD